MARRRKSCLPPLGDTPPATEPIWARIPGWGLPITSAEDFELARQYAEAAAWNSRLDKPKRKAG